MTGTLSTPGTSQMRWEPDTSLLDAAREIAPIIRAHSEQAERERRLSQPVLKALRETGFLRMTTPRSLGGLETDPVTRALVGEEIGRHDSAAAWTLENPLDWAFFCCRLPDEGVEEIYSRGADILIAAQFGRPLKATSANGGYRISGRAPFVSNCYDADWISSTVLVDEDGSSGDEPEMCMVYFRSEECKIIDTWDVMGMRGTGSNDISVTDVYVPRSRTIERGAKADLTKRPHPISGPSASLSGVILLASFRTGNVDGDDCHFACRSDDFHGALATLTANGSRENAAKDDPKCTISSSPAGFPHVFLLDPGRRVSPREAVPDAQ